MMKIVGCTAGFMWALAFVFKHFMHFIVFHYFNAYMSLCSMFHLSARQTFSLGKLQLNVYAAIKP